MNVTNLIEGFLKDNKGYLAIYMLFMFSFPIASVYLPKYYGQIIEDLKEDKSPSFKLVLILLLLTNAMYLSLDKLDTIFVPKLQAFVRVNIVKAVMDNYKDKFQEQELGMLISIIVKLPMVIRDLFWEVRNYVVPLILIMITVVFRFMVIDKRLGVMTLVGVLSGIVILTPMVKNCIHKSYKMDSEADIIHENISELFDNLLDIYSSNTHDRELNNLTKKQDDIISRYERTAASTNKLRGWLNGIAIVTFFSVIIYSYQLYRRKEMDLTGVVNVTVTSMFIIGKIGSFSGEIPDMIFNLGVYMRAQKYLKKLNKPEPKEDYQITNGEITYRGVGIKYGDKQVIKDFNLIIKPSESVAIIGKIGSGKSSLVKALLKLIPYEGHIYVDGKDISELDPATIRSQVIYVRQNPIPFNRTLYENIVYGNERVSKAHVADLFAKYELHGFFEHDLDDMVGKKGQNMSGGQKMVMFLLRIMIQNDKKVIILDEPTSSLDNATAKKIIGMIRDVTEKQTTVIITHDDRLRSIVDRVIEIA